MKGPRSRERCPMFALGSGIVMDGWVLERASSDKKALRVNRASDMSELGREGN